MTKCLVSLLTALLLSACSSPPKLAMPDGGSRSPINTKTDIDDYIAKSPRQVREIREQTELAREVDTVRRDVATLKLYMTAMAAQLESSPSSLADGAPPARVPTRPASSKSNSPRLAVPTEAIKLGDDSIMFRMMFSKGGSAFIPSADFRQKLLKAASAGGQVEIRSASDARIPSAANEKILTDRVDSARQYLIANGVSPDKIKTRFFSVGAFIADNTTAEGRSKNRRTEIEIRGLSASAHPKLEKQPEGAAP